MTDTVPTQVNKTPSQSDSARFRRLRKYAVLSLLLAFFLYWQRKPVLGPPLSAVVNSYIADRDLVSARQWVQTAQRLLPNDPAFALLEAKVARRAGDMQTVTEALKKASKLGAARSDLNREQWLALAQSGQMIQAEPHLAPLLTDPNYDNKEVCEAFVIGYIRSHRTDAALSLLDPWIADAADDATPLLQRARIYQLLSAPQKAEDDFRAAISIEPDWNTPRLGFAELLVTQSRFSEAAEYFQQLLANYSTDDQESSVRICIGLAECHVAEGKMQDAVTLLRNACRIDARSLDAQVALGRSLLETGEYDNCIDPLLVALELRPGYDETHYLLAQAYSLSGRPDKADQHLRIVSAAREALEELDSLNADVLTDPNNAAKLIRAGEIMMTYGDPEEGVLRVLTGLDHEPDNVTGLHVLTNHYRGKAERDPSFRQLASDFQQRLDNADNIGAGQTAP